MPSTSLLLGVGAILSTLSSTAFAVPYQIKETYTADNWLDAFAFKQYDLNNGFVNYVDEATARKMNMYYKSGDGDIMFGVDSTEKLSTTGAGRKSVRLEGRTNYNQGLFIIDIKTLPSMCGIWPSFWSLGQEPWPVKGEIDIIEGVNDQVMNKYVLHTNTQCTVSGQGQTGNQALTDCALDTAGSAGCDVNDARTNSFGKGFNSNNGGVYAMEWTNEAIRTWFFPRGSSMPASLVAGAPNTDDFGTPAANFKGSCNIEQRFKDQRFIFTNNFCGDWAGNVYSQSSCPKYYDGNGAPLNSMDMCKKYVAENPTAFKNAFWKISSFKTYTKKTISSSSSVRSSTISSSSTRISSSIASSTRVSTSTTLSRSTISASSSVASSSKVNSSVVSSSTRASSSVASSTSVSSSAASSSKISSSMASSSKPSSSIASSTKISSSLIASSTKTSSSVSIASSTKISSSVASSTKASSSLPSSSMLSSSKASSSIASSTKASSSSLASVSASSSINKSNVVVSFAQKGVLGDSLPSSVMGDDFPRASDYPDMLPSSLHYGDVSSSSVDYEDAAPSSVHYDGASSSVYYEDTRSNSVYYENSASRSTYYDAPAPSAMYGDDYDSDYPASSIAYPTGASSHVAYPTASSVTPYPTDSYNGEDKYPSYDAASSSAPVHGNGYDAKSTPVYGNGYEVQSSAVYDNGYDAKSTPVYGNGYNAESTPAYGQGYDVKSSAVYGNGYDAKPSKPVKADDYPNLPDFTPLSAYPETTTKPSYGGDNDYEDYPESSKTTSTTTVTYVDVCETGYTTITTTHVVTYGPGPSTPVAAKPTPGSNYPVYPPPGFEITTKICNKGCGNGPKTVTVPVPTTKYTQYPPTKPTGKLSTTVPTVPAVPSVPSVPMKPVSSVAHTIYSTIYHTRVVTFSKPSIPASKYPAQHSSSSIVYGGEKPSKPAQTPEAYKPGKPVAKPSAGYAYPASNGTVHFSTGAVKPTASKTAYSVPEFTGAASTAQVGGVVAMLAFAAMLL